MAYEPSWYRSLREARVLGRGPVLIPEADLDVDATVLVPDERDIEISLPDLEATRRDDEEQ